MQSIAWSSTELENQYNYLSSGHWFDKSTMNFFKSRVTGNYKRIDDNNAFFITTEKGPSGVRNATIRRAELVKYIRESDGRECFKITINSHSEFNQLTLAQAKRQLTKL